MNIGPIRDPYDPNVQLENAARLFLNRGALVAAIALFAYLGNRQPHHSPLWYGLGNGLARLAHERRSRALLRLAIAVLCRSVREDPANPLSPPLLDLLRDRSGVPAADYEAIAPFEGSPLPLLQAIGFSPDALVEAALAMPDWQDRMRIVMYLRQQDIEEVAPLLVATIERDPHPDVRMAALKFLGRWGARSDVCRCLERLVSSGEWRRLQPYALMALRPIQQQWAQQLADQIDEDRSG